jgi:hypothetical protein
VSFAPAGPVLWGLGPYDKPALTFQGRDDFGVEWVCEDPQGWGRTTVATPILDAPAGGGWFGPGRRTVKVMTLRGGFRACDTTTLDAAEARLRAALEHYTDDTTLWRGGTGVAQPQQMTVRLTGDLDVDPVQSTPTVRTFSAVLTAADPYKYAAGAAGLRTVRLGFLAPDTTGGITPPFVFPLSLSGGADPSRRSDINPGDVPVYGNLTITGPVVDGQVTHLGLGRYFGVSGTLAAGTAATSNFQYANLLVDGVSARGRRLPGSVYWQVQPGRNDLRFSGNPGMTSADISPATGAVLTYRPAWR